MVRLDQYEQENTGGTGHGYVSGPETAAALCRRGMQQRKRVVAAKDLQMHLVQRRHLSRWARAAIVRKEIDGTRHG